MLFYMKILLYLSALIAFLLHTTYTSIMLISSFSKNIRSHTGGIAVSFVIFLCVLVSLVSFVINLGYLYAQKNKYQNAVESAAMSGAVSLCKGDREYVEKIVRKIADENGISDEDGTLSIVFGFYDEMDDYGDFSTYKDFTPEENMPSGEYVNAVYVSYKKEDAVLIKMGQEAGSSAAAVVYLKRLDIVSLDPEGEIQIGHESTWDDVVFFSNHDIKYPQGKDADGSYHPEPEFNGSLLLAAGELLSCPVGVSPRGWSGERMEIHWDSGSPQSGGNIRTGIDPITHIPEVDDEYLEKWRQKADIVYTPDQAGKDNVFYGKARVRNLEGGEYYYFDLTGQKGIIFFDARETDNPILICNTTFNQTSEFTHTANGNRISELTFVANRPITITNSRDRIYIGGEGEEQAVFISGQDITLFGGPIKYDGAVFRTGGDFILFGGGGIFNQKIRIIADGSVLGKDNNDTDYIGSPGLYQIECTSRFGPPCPPNIPRLGLLTPVSSE